MANIHSISSVKREEKVSGTQMKWKQSIEDEIKLAIRSALSSASQTSDIFPKLVERFEAFYARPSTNMVSLRKSTRHEKGEFFEHFCLMYLRAKNYGKAWLLGDVPDDVLEGLGLARKDNGIDIIVEHSEVPSSSVPPRIESKTCEGSGEASEARVPVGYFAVQAKWRSNPHKRTRIQLGWSKLATFFALAARTGPYLKHIVMTNCHSIKRNGNRTWKMDQTIARAGFEKCSREFWQLMAGLGSGYSLNDEKVDEEVEESEEKLETKTENNPKEQISETIRNDTKRRQAFLDKFEAKLSGTLTSGGIRFAHSPELPHASILGGTGEHGAPENNIF